MNPATCHAVRDPGKVCFITFGCQMNRLDSELAASAFVSAGFLITAEPGEAGVVVINTCSVRRHAEERALANLGRFRREKQRCPDLVLALMGCMAQKDGLRLLHDRPYLDIVCGTSQFTRLPELVARARAEGTRLAVTDEADVRVRRVESVRPERHRAYVSILRGCNSFCSYCVVPYVRGREASRAPDEIEREIRTLLDDGCVEIILLGQNVDAYRCGDADLAALLRRLDPLPGLRRLRFVTSHPKDISTRLLDAVAELPAVCEHIHMPAQSGSDRILKAMNRGYTAAHYRELVETARGKVPGLQIASDFIVGFPGETDADFDATLDLVRACRFNQSFIFKYSPREGTHAARLADDVPREVKEQRNHALLAAQESVSRELHKRQEGQTVEVMVDGPSKRAPARLTGRTRGNDIVVFDLSPGAPPPEPGSLVNVRITGSTPLTLFGQTDTNQ